jgi:NAD-dependent deacetylase
MTSDTRIDDIARLIDDAERILFITGAGLSADSGLPTYRGIGGLYNDQHTDDGIPIEVALSGDMLRRRPEVTWKYLLQVETACRGAGHNLAHRVIAEIEKIKPQTWVLTQNIDCFHRHAGSRQLIEIHGRVDQVLCTHCHYQQTVKDYSGFALPPACPRCHAVIRPNVVLFGEMLPDEAVRLYHREMLRGFDLVFSVGTTSVFPYIAQPVFDVRKWGGRAIEINPGITEVSSFVHHKLDMRAVDAMSRIWQALGHPLPATKDLAVAE